MTREELASLLGVTGRTVTKWVAAGCPSKRIGSGSRAKLDLDPREVKAWMRATSRTGEAGRPAAGLEATTGSGKATDDLDTDHKGDLAELIRRTNLQIKRLEVRKRERLEAEAEGALVPLSDVRRAWAAQVEVVQARFRVLPSLLSQRLIGKSYEDAHAILEEELRGVLLSFAREELAV